MRRSTSLFQRLSRARSSFGLIAPPSCMATRLSPLPTLRDARLEKRMSRLPPPTQDELQGIKELVLEHLSHPALAALSPASQTQSPSVPISLE